MGRAYHAHAFLLSVLLPVVVTGSGARAQESGAAAEPAEDVAAPSGTEPSDEPEAEAEAEAEAPTEAGAEAADPAASGDDEEQVSEDDEAAPTTPATQS